ncbi:K+/H+ antiporter subunit F [Lysobacter aestuarii]|uniref:K+/H+ antiporter subunit F n=2 Tax=Marilutibacter aestuarii TaxID=1706195 RepID=A0A507ZP80_9GAMM|nr:K+/H+ antiporter subunit F [Lysobacter aestuarii]TQD39556.1 K+/H+ antiporter subunit F [Lysobacter aestuarii]
MALASTLLPGDTLVDKAVTVSLYMVGIALLLSLYRLLRGPSVPDRILALDTLYVNTIAALILFGMQLHSAVYFEAALVIAMLGFVGTVMLSKYVLRRDIVE